MKERVSVPLANHTVLIARDGTERPIDDCAVPIVDGAEDPAGGVMVLPRRQRTQAGRERSGESAG